MIKMTLKWPKHILNFQYKVWKNYIENLSNYLQLASLQQSKAMTENFYKSWQWADLLYFSNNLDESGQVITTFWKFHQRIKCWISWCCLNQFWRIPKLNFGEFQNWHKLSWCWNSNILCSKQNVKFFVLLNSVNTKLGVDTVECYLPVVVIYTCKFWNVNM